MCAAKAAKRIWRRQCGQVAIGGPGAPLLAHATSKPGSSTWFDDIPIESIEDVPIVVEDLP